MDDEQLERILERQAKAHQQHTQDAIKEVTLRLPSEPNGWSKWKTPLGVILSSLVLLGFAFSLLTRFVPTDEEVTAMHKAMTEAQQELNKALITRIENHEKRDGIFHPVPLSKE